MKTKNEFDLIAVGQRLHNVRKALKLTIDQMKKKAKISHSMISDVEKGQKKVSTIYLNILANDFNVDLNYVFTGEGNIFKDNQAMMVLDEDIIELVETMNRDKLIKYTMLSYFLKYKVQSKALIYASLSQSMNEQEEIRLLQTFSEPGQSSAQNKKK